MKRRQPRKAYRSVKRKKCDSVSTTSFHSIPYDLLILIAKQLRPYDRANFRDISTLTRMAVDRIGFMPKEAYYVVIQDEILKCHFIEYSIILAKREDSVDNAKAYVSTEDGTHLMHNEFRFRRAKIVVLGNKWEAAVVEFLRNAENIETLVVVAPSRTEQWPGFQFKKKVETFIVCFRESVTQKELLLYTGVCVTSRMLMLAAVWENEIQETLIELPSIPWKSKQISSHWKVEFQGFIFPPDFNPFCSYNILVSIKSPWNGHINIFVNSHGHGVIRELPWKLKKFLFGRVRKVSNRITLYHHHW